MCRSPQVIASTGLPAGDLAAGSRERLRSWKLPSGAAFTWRQKGRPASSISTIVAPMVWWNSALSPAFFSM
jgi:hypothetical protein